MKHAVLLIADIHAGFDKGLMLPGTKFENDGIEYERALTPIQEKLATQFALDIMKSKEMIEDTPVSIFVDGDLTSGNRFRSELVSTRDDDQLVIAERIILALLCVGDVVSLTFIRGTGVHNFGEGSSEMSMCRMVRALRPGIVTSMVNGFDGYISGVKFNIAHHGPTPGTKITTQGNSARNYLRTLMLDRLVKQLPVSDIVARAHYHGFAWETLRVVGNTSHILILPPYCGMSEHAQKVTRDMGEGEVGVVVILVEDGGYSVNPLVHPI